MCLQCRKPGLGRSPGKGNDNPLQYSCLENPTDRGAWWATVHSVAKSQTRLSTNTSLHHGFYVIIRNKVHTNVAFCADIEARVCTVKMCTLYIWQNFYYLALGGQERNSGWNAISTCLCTSAFLLVLVDSIGIFCPLVFSFESQLLHWSSPWSLLSLSNLHHL